MKFLSNIDLNQNELQNAKIQNLATAPSNPQQGQIYYHTGEKRFYGYNGISWVDLGQTWTPEGMVDAINQSLSIIDDNILSLSVRDAITKKHNQNTDTTLTGSGVNTINTTGTGNIVDFKVNNLIKSSIDKDGKFIGTASNASSVPWSGVSSKPTTLAGYGITDATPSNHIGSGGNAHANATQSIDGFMSSVDKTKLDTMSKTYTDMLIWDVNKQNNWMRIAQSDLDHAPSIGTFEIYWQSGSLYNGRVVFTVGQSWGKDASIVQIHYTSGNVNGITMARVLHDMTTPGGKRAYLELYNFGMSGQVFCDIRMINCVGWSYFLNEGSIPSGYKDTNISFNNGISTTGKICSSEPIYPPLSVASGAKVSLLNVDRVDNYHAGNASGEIPVSNGTLNTNLNADMVDGKHVGNSADNVLLLDSSGFVPSTNLPNSGATAGTYRSVTVDAKGRVTGGTNPTTLAGYGITDASSSTHNHTLDSLSNVTIASNSSGQILKWNGSAWINNTLAQAGIQPAGSYLTGNQSITLSGDITGTGTTAISTTLKNVGTAGTYTKVTTDAQGRVISGTGMSASDIPTLTLSKISDAGTAASKNTGTAVGNVPILGADGKLDSSILPAIAITETYVVNSQTAMLALVAETGDVAVRTDLNKSFILKGVNPATLTDWQELLTPTDAVLSVNGKTGTVTVTATDVGLGNVTNESKATMFTNASLTGVPTAPTASASTNTTQIATTAYVKSQNYITSVQAPVQSVAGKTGAVSLTNSDVGLGNVENKSSATIRSEITKSNVTTALGYTPVNKYAVTIGDGTTTTFTITHNLATMDITVFIREATTPYNQVIADIQLIDANSIRVLFASAPTSGQFRVIITG